MGEVVNLSTYRRPGQAPQVVDLTPIVAHSPAPEGWQDRTVLVIASKWWGVVLGQNRRSGKLFVMHRTSDGPIVRQYARSELRLLSPTDPRSAA